MGNDNISSDVKDNLLSLIEIFVNNFPEVSLKYLEENIKTLKIDRVSKYVTDSYAYYNGNINTLYIKLYTIRR